MAISLMNKLFLVLLCGLPFAHFIFPKPDMWYGQGHWFQVGILFLLCCSFIEKPKSIQILNRPLALFTLWTGIVTAYYWQKVMIRDGHYPILIFLPFFNYLCFILFYKLSIEYLNKENIEKILKYLSYSVLLVMFYCVLQKLNLDQFFVSMEGRQAPDELVGTIGNTSHLAGYLAICQPLYFKKGLLNYLALTLLWLIIFATGSVSGIITGIMLLFFWLFFKKLYIYSIALGGVGLISGIILFLKIPKFFTFNHRIEFWKLAYPIFKNTSITGAGLGIMNGLKLKLDGSLWRHIHCEPYQLAVELGIIGLVLAIWCIGRHFVLFNTFRTDLTIRLTSIFVGFCILSLFTYPAHLWLTGSFGMLSYSWLYALKNEVS